MWLSIAVIEAQNRLVGQGAMLAVQRLDAAPRMIGVAEPSKWFLSSSSRTSSSMSSRIFSSFVRGRLDGDDSYHVFLWRQ
jgi:hypothetical protein